MLKNKITYLIAILILIISFSLIYYLHTQRKQEKLLLLTVEKQINHLVSLADSVDKDILSLMSFQLNNFDSLAKKTIKLKQIEKQLSQNYQLTSTLLQIESFDKQLKMYLKESQQKQQLLEHVKSVYASYQITLRYIPILIENLKSIAHSNNNNTNQLLTDLSFLIYDYSLFKEQQTKNLLQKNILTLQSLMLEHEVAIKIEKLLLHTRRNIDYYDDLINLLKQYQDLHTREYLQNLRKFIEAKRSKQVQRSYDANNVFLISIAFLLSGLIFALQYYRRARSQAIASRDMFLDAIESINESFAIYDNQDNLILWNKKFEQYYPRLKGFLKPGLSFEQVVDECIRCKQFSNNDYSDSEIKQLMLVSHKENLKNILEQTSEGCSFLANSNRTHSGGIASITIDITERQKMELHLLELSRAVEQSPSAVVITDTKGIISYVNPKFEQITGYSSAEAIGQNPSILKSGETPAKEYKKMWEVINAGKVWHGVFHNKKKEGQLFWERATMAPIKDDSQQIIGYLAIKEDITQSKKNEEQVRMASMVFETSSEAIIVTDANNIIKLVNPSFEKITGYSAKEIIGSNPSILSSGEQEKDFYQKMWKHLYATGRWQGEVWNKRKNGEVYPEWLSIALIQDKEKNIVEHVAVFSDISDRKKAEDKIHWQANFDHLTQLPNRSLFLDRLNQFIRNYKREAKPFALLFLDLDRFKIVNDTLGHDTGDKLLQMVSDRLRNSLSESDTIARFGGDEFIIILPRINTKKGVAQGAAHVAERLVEQISKAFIINSSEVFIGCTIGITLFPDDAIDEINLIRNADMAMYHAKENGRNSYHFYTETMNNKMLSRMQLEKDLHHAVAANEFFLEFQPVVEINSNGKGHKVVGAEALVRWNHPTMGRLGPDSFISIAEETGIIKQLGEWVLDSALAELALWHQLGHKELHIAVNVSSAQRLLGFDQKRIQQSLSKFKIKAEDLTIEITESLLMDHTGDSLAWLESFSEIGIKLSIDDFGTGFSSLNYLHRFPMDVLKVDKSFVDNLLHDNKNARLVDSIISLAHNFDLSVVAEGVEEKAQLKFLQKLGCNYIQGYYFSRPLASENFINYATNYVKNKGI